MKGWLKESSLARIWLL